MSKRIVEKPPVSGQTEVVGGKTSSAPVVSRCCAQVSNEGRWPSFHRCTRAAKVERNGKPYCSTHDPVKQAERWEAKREQWRKEDERETQAAAWKDAALGLCEGVDIGTLNALGTGWLKAWLASPDATTKASEVLRDPSNSQKRGSHE